MSTEDTINSIRKVSTNEIIFVAILFSALIAPGLLVIGVFKPEYLESLNVLVLFLLSLSITVPIFSANAAAFITVALFRFKGHLDIESNAGRFVLIGLVMLFTILGLTIPLLLSLLFDLRFQGYLYGLLGSQTCLYILYLSMYKLIPQHSSQPK